MVSHCACPTSTFRFAIPLFREWPRRPFTARIERAQFHRARSASKKGTWSLPATFFSILLGLCCEMGREPIANRCGHLVKILLPSELVICAWQKNQPLWTSQRITQSPALMEGDTFIPLTLDNQRGHGDLFSRPIGNLSEAVFVKVIPQTDAIWPSHDVRNRIRGLPPCQLFRPECQAKLFRKVHHRTFEGQTGDIATLGCREDGDEPSKA